MRDICVVTGTRAEYHILYPLIEKLQNSDKYNLRLAVTGSHLHSFYGETYRDIESDGIAIDVKIPILSEQDTISDINHAISRAIDGFDRYFSEKRPDLMILLGDRYELMAAAIVAMNHRIPIGHICGGETTEGAVDECIRHSITKMASIHFPCCEPYRNRIIQMGEDPRRVFDVGDLGVENTLRTERMTREKLSESLGFDLSGQFGVLTFHPVTLEEDTAEEEFREILDALDEFPELRIIFTKANADSGGNIINSMIDKYAEMHEDRCASFFSLGMVRYLSAISMADVVIGNSSSGISETPSFAVPTINIGDRQKGRIQAKNILNCEPICEDICRTMKKALSPEFREYVADTVNPFGDGTASEQIMEKLDYFFDNPELFSLKKRFYDIEFSV